MESLVAARSPKKRVSHNLSTVDFLFGEKKRKTAIKSLGFLKQNELWSMCAPVMDVSSKISLYK